MYKIKDVETRIKNDGVDLGDIAVDFTLKMKIQHL
ncbi:Tail fiber protein [Staphylococcus aureus]|nr:Tail fiber protein [Staphylococcus aureus]